MFSLSQALIDNLFAFAGTLTLACSPIVVAVVMQGRKTRAAQREQHEATRESNSVEHLQVLDALEGLRSEVAESRSAFVSHIDTYHRTGR